MGSDAGRREGLYERWLSVSWFEVASAFEVLHDAEWLVVVAVFPAAMLESPLPTRRQDDIRLPSQAARIAICGRFPGPVRCVFVAAAGSPAGPVLKTGRG